MTAQVIRRYGAVNAALFDAAWVSALMHGNQGLTRTVLRASQRDVGRIVEPAISLNTSRSQQAAKARHKHKARTRNV